MTWRGTTGTRLAAFAVVVALAFGGGALLGATAGPDPGGDPVEQHDGGGSHG